MSASLSRIRPASGYLLPAFFLVAGLAALILFGFAGIGRGEAMFAFDMRYLYGAGAMWVQLTSPYDVEAFKATMLALLGIESGSFAYPPNAFPVAAILSSGSAAQADVLIGLVDLAALAVLLLFIHQGLAATAGPGLEPDQRDRALALIAAGVVIGNPFTAHVVWMGQMTLISAALVYGSWLCAHHRKDVLAGVLLGLSAFKPQLAFLVGLWFLLDRRWLLLAAAAGATLAASLWPIVTTGVEGSWLAWVRTLGEYQDTEYNVVTFRHVFGLRSVLAGTGLPAPPLMPAGIAALIGLYLIRRHYHQIWLINAILIISFLFLFAHDYDVAPVAVLALPLLMAARGRPGVLALICLAAVIVYFPQRIWEKLDIGGMARSREIALLAMLVLYLMLCRLPLLAAPRSRAAASAG